MTTVLRPVLNFDFSMLIFHSPLYEALIARLVSGRAIARTRADRMETKRRDVAVAVKSVMGSSIWFEWFEWCTGFASSFASRCSTPTMMEAGRRPGVLGRVRIPSLLR